MRFTFTESAKRDTEKLPKKIQLGLRERLLYWQSSENPLIHAKPLTQHLEATHRFRFSVYRILIKQIGDELRVLRIRHRKDVYRC
ncbi:MAG: type II toxin-antitoxin system RelE/ParE family toxin [Candidatus Berkelbacteria bacterium]|nr:type II toxin-antitoxin system RelE/ParE family toxin [Candidatus Berkelbacteria bacterium]MCR4307852.1 type II toxin-antitoxin system RelE/ParE family toxin [Candidatus Berkelbacteria bacterium]